MHSTLTHRNLGLLGRTASTARVLNLARLADLYGDDPEYKARPFFKTPYLNSAVILKHSVRGHERTLFNTVKYLSTKIVVPFDAADLALGGRTVLVGQMGWEEQLGGLGMEAEGLARDCEVLRALDQIPSLDPFLVREHLARRGFEMAPCYLALAPADVERMRASVKAELGQLIGLAFGGGGNANQTTKMVELMLTDEADERLEPLRLTLRLEGDAYREGIFAWKGFLYFKWSLDNTRLGLIEAKRGLEGIQPTMSTDPGTQVEVIRIKKRLIREIDRCEQAALNTLKLYDKAFAGLIADGNPAVFRDFLLRAPRLFITLGECVGGISHIASYWAYRYPRGGGRITSAQAALEIFHEFDNSLPVREDVAIAGAEGA